MTIEDLRWKGVREFRSEPTGAYRINRNGRRVPVTEGVEYIDTIADGRMKIEDWYRAMEQAVIQEGKTELLDKLIKYCHKLAWTRTEKAAKEHALECLSSEAYKRWDDFPKKNKEAKMREYIKDTVYRYPFLVEKPDGLYFKDEKIGERKIVLLTLGGSYAYGTNVEGSDIDVRGIALRTEEEILLGKDFEQFTDVETDTVIYSFDKMLSLLSKCNPNTIEILGVKREDIIYIDPIGEELLRNKEMFLSKKAIFSFASYANSQLHRLSNRSVRGVSQEEREVHILKSIQNAENVLKERYQETGDSINLYVDKAVNPDMETEIFMDVNLSHYPLRDYKDHWSEMNSIVKSYKKIGKRNNSAYNRGKITKHCMHLIRLYYMLFDILEKGEVNTYREKERDFLLQIRDGLFFDGEVPKPELYEYVEKLEIRLEYLKEYTSLPEEPDFDGIAAFQKKVNKSIVLKDVKQLETDKYEAIYGVRDGKLDMIYAGRKELFSRKATLLTNEDVDVWRGVKAALRYKEGVRSDS